MSALGSRIVEPMKELGITSEDKLSPRALKSTKLNLATQAQSTWISPFHTFASPSPIGTQASVTIADSIPSNHEDDVFKGRGKSVDQNKNLREIKATTTHKLIPESGGILLPEFALLDSRAFKLTKKGFVLLQFAPAVGIHQYDWSRKQVLSLSVAKIRCLFRLCAKDSYEFFHGHFKDLLSVKIKDESLLEVQVFDNQKVYREFSSMKEELETLTTQIHCLEKEKDTARQEHNDMKRKFRNVLFIEFTYKASEVIKFQKRILNILEILEVSRRCHAAGDKDHETRILSQPSLENMVLFHKNPLDSIQATGAKNDINSVYSIKVNYTNQKFPQQVFIRDRNKVHFVELNPFPNEGEEVAVVGYHYRSWEIDNDMYWAARCEVQSFLDESNVVIIQISRHASGPWGLVLKETHQALIAIDYKKRVRLRVNGGFKGGVFVFMPAAMGIDKYAVRQLKEFERKRLVSAVKIGLELQETEDKQQNHESRKEKFEESSATYLEPLMLHLHYRSLLVYPLVLALHMSWNTRVTNFSHHLEDKVNLWGRVLLCIHSSRIF